LATNYPGALDTFTNPTAGDYQNSGTVPHATQHANANDAILAIETELGINPKGSFASVADALAGKANATTTITAGDGLTGGGDLSAGRSLAVDSTVVRTSRSITAGTGLIGGGDLSADRSLAVAYGTVAGTAAQGNDSRIVSAVPNTRTITAGTGLDGGGDLSANRSLSVTYGTSSGTAAQGNDSRIVNAVPNTRSINAGTGLNGGGALTADRTLSVAYGTTSGTAAQGNDSRIVNAVQYSDGTHLNIPSDTKVLIASTSDASTAAGNEPAFRIGNPSGTHIRMDNNEFIAMSDDTHTGTFAFNCNLNIATGAGQSVKLGSGGFSFLGMNGGITASGNVSDSSGYIFVPHGLGAVPKLVLASFGSSATAYAQLTMMHAPAGDTSTNIRFQFRNSSNGAVSANAGTPAIEWLAFI